MGVPDGYRPGLERIFISGSATNQDRPAPAAAWRSSGWGPKAVSRTSSGRSNTNGGRSRLRGDRGGRIWESWAVLAYDIDTVV